MDARLGVGLGHHVQQDCNLCCRSLPGSADGRQTLGYLPTAYSLRRARQGTSYNRVGVRRNLADSRAWAVAMSVREMRVASESAKHRG